tara:strand:+ start:525 stop:689 length:165 start_codon:yes stop_codon:yes gene_type:complete
MIKGVASKHSTHQMEVRKGKGPHEYQLWCKACNKHVQWVNAKQAMKITHMEAIQ